MNIAETLHGLVFDDEPKSTQAPKATPQPGIAPKPILSNSQPVNQSGFVADSVDQRMVEMLRTRLQSCSAQATINKFMAAADSLKRFIPDERQRYQAAVEQMQLAGVSPQEIVGAFDALNNALEDQTTKYKATSDAQKSLLRPKQDNVAKLSRELERKQAEIKEMNSQIDTLTADITTEQRRIEATDRRFETALNAVRQEIQNSASQIRTYIEDK